MATVHTFTINVRKGQNELLEKRAKQQNPVGSEDTKKQNIPKQLEYWEACRRSLRTYRPRRLQRRRST